MVCRLTASDELGGGTANTEPHRPFAALDGPDEHAAVPIPSAPTRITPVSSCPRHPTLFTHPSSHSRQLPTQRLTGRPAPGVMGFLPRNPLGIGTFPDGASSRLSEPEAFVLDRRVGACNRGWIPRLQSIHKLPSRSLQAAVVRMLSAGNDTSGQGNEQIGRAHV